MPDRFFVWRLSASVKFITDVFVFNLESNIALDAVYSAVLPENDMNGIKLACRFHRSRLLLLPGFLWV